MRLNYSLDEVLAFYKLELTKDLCNKLLNLDHISYLRPHEDGVAVLSYMMAKELGMPQDRAAHISLVASMHDFGKMSIPDSILLKPGNLTEEEKSIMSQHTIAGYEILTSIHNNPFFSLAGIVALQHHERYNGEGYPNKLKGNEIIFEARLVAICDCYDALRHSRAYKEKLSHDATMSIINKQKEFYDPLIYNAFLKIEKVIQRVWNRRFSKNIIAHF